MVQVELSKEEIDILLTLLGSENEGSFGGGLSDKLESKFLELYRQEGLRLKQ